MRALAAQEPPYNTCQRQTCKACGRPDKFDFFIPDELWHSVVPPELAGRVVCLFCFDDFASRRGVQYADALRSLYFAGDAATFEFVVAWRVN